MKMSTTIKLLYIRRRFSGDWLQ